MNFWNVIAILGGLTILIVIMSIISKYTGIGEFLGNVLHVISTFFQTIFSMLQSLIYAAPKQLRILFFMIIFVTTGALIYNSTIGVTVTCYDGNAYRSDWLTGLTANMLPENATAQYEAFADLPENVATGPIVTDDSGNLKILIPDEFAVNTARMLTKTFGRCGIWGCVEAGIMETTDLYGFGLTYVVCKTGENACFLADTYRGDFPSDPYCKIRNISNIDQVVAWGFPLYWVTISYDQSKSNEVSQGLVSYVKSNWMGPSFLTSLGTALGAGKNSNPLEECSISGADTDWPWIATTKSQDMDLEVLSGVVYSGKVFNAISYPIRIAVTPTDGSIYGYNVRKQVVGAPVEDDPEYREMQKYARTRFNFIADGIKDGSFTKINTTRDDLIQYSCSKSGSNEELMMLGAVPIFNSQFILMFVGVIILLGIVGFIKRV